jgi:hypothetical protein
MRGTIRVQAEESAGIQACGRPAEMFGMRRENLLRCDGCCSGVSENRRFQATPRRTAVLFK